MERIERYTGKYGQDVIELILDIQQHEFGLPITIDDQPDLREVEKFYFRNNGGFWLAIEGEKVVGTIALIDIGNRQSALRKMFVHKEYRGKEKAIAQKLINILIDWCEQSGIGEIYLGTIDTMIAAHRFYEKNGFVEIEKLALPPNFPVVRVDNKFFMRSLNRANT
jgi:GNAT superfamily N-acetyltransferase